MSDPDPATGWFEPLYADAAAGHGEVPWDDRRASPAIAERVEPGDGRRAIVVGCGLGDDAELVASRGWRTIAFDIAPSAVRGARERFPDSAAEFRVADLLAPPPEWRGAFDLVVEHYTVQALPPALRERATAAVTALVAPGGRLIVQTLATEDGSDERPGPPWRLTRAELDAFARDGLAFDDVDETDDARSPGWVAQLSRSRGGGRVDLREAAQTMLMTLYLRAQDAASPHPILGDRFAQELVDRIDYDFAALRRLRGNLPLIAARAKAIDERVRRFVAAHPDGTVVHLACGLDSRVLRIDPPRSLLWIDVDQPQVIDVRERLYAPRAGVRTVAASVTDAAAWADVPSDRPTLAVGEGLLMYLPPSAVADTIGRALASAGDVELLFDTVAPWVRRIAGWQPNFRRAGAAFASTTGDADRAIAAHAGVVLTDDVSLVGEARRASSGALAAAIAVFDRVPGAHDAMRLRTHARSSSHAA